MTPEEQRRYYLTHKDEILEKTNRYKKEHKEHLKDYHRKYYLQHRESILLRCWTSYKTKPKPVPFKPHDPLKYIERKRKKICPQGFLQLPQSFEVTFE